jgi:hypothetical protein
VLFDEIGEPPICTRFNPDGSIVENACENPLDPNIDIVCTTLSRFGSLFFSAGGVSTLPADYWQASEVAFARRELYYFDETAGYRREEFVSFFRMVEFLFAEDLDVLVGTTTMSPSRIDELSFLEVLAVPQANEQPIRGIRFVSAVSASEAEAMVSAAADCASKGSTGLVVNSSGDVAAAVDALVARGVVDVVRYDSSIPGPERRQVYAGLRVRERSGLHTVVVGDGPAIEVSDLSFRHVVTGPATPEALVRRAGRCNRRNEYDDASIVVVGNAESVSDRAMSEYGRAMYMDALASIDGAFDAGAWIAFIG